MKQLFGLQWWHLFKYAELTEVVRQNDLMFIDFLNNVWVGNIDNEVEKSFKARFIHESDCNYSNILCICWQRMNLLKNEAVLNELYTVELNVKIPDHSKYTLATI